MASRQAVLNALRKQQDLARERAGRARKVTLPVPVGGWNTRDSDTRISPLFAQKFTNLVSSRNGIRPRKNPVLFASASASVEPTALMVHNGTDGTETMFVAVTGKVFDVSSGGASNTPDLSVGGIMSYANVNGRLVWANGFDAPQGYDGSTWSVQPISVDPATTAVTAASLAGLFPFKNRVYWWKFNKLGFWYSTLDTIGDSLKFFDLSYVAREGGDLLTITRYTVDGGSGPDDYPVFITSKGEALIYQGTNPNDASTWAFVGSFMLGQPPLPTNPQRAHLAESWGAQTWVITCQDYVALPQAVTTEGIVSPSLLAGEIQRLVRDYGTEHGWQALLYPKGPWLLFNCPTALGNPPTYEQHIIDLHTMAPSRLTGMNGRAWAVFNDDLYYATQADSPTGRVKIYKALATSTPVSIEFMPGATDLQSNGSKALTAYRVWASTSSGDVLQTSATTEIRQDYTDSGNNVAQQLRWNEWILAGGVGTYIQLEILGKVNANVEIKHIDYIFEDGDPVLRFNDL